MKSIGNFLAFVGTAVLTVAVQARGEVSLESLLSEMTNFDAVATMAAFSIAYSPDT